MDQPAAAQSNGRRALVAAWLGWAFDGLDSYLFIGVAIPLVKRLSAAADPALASLPDKALTDLATTRAAWIQAAFFIGWALGGAVFGRIGDRIGRTKVLSLTILTYALFTGLGFFATEWWHLLIFRFLAALGIGGEWAAGSALVCETLHARHKAWASALLQSGYILGIIAATLTGGLFKTPGQEQYVFLMGILPALCVLWIRRFVHEPPAWKNAAAGQRVPRVGELFAPGVRHVTLLVGAFVSLSLVAAWVFIFFTPQVVRLLAAAEPGRSKADAQQIVTYVSLAYFGVNLAANFVATYLAK
ncbi:MAG: MFS transporter, partial [Phycisphaerales bacterium]